MKKNRKHIRRIIIRDKKTKNLIADLIAIPEKKGHHICGSCDADDLLKILEMFTGEKFK